jgi:hypothetical protein
MTGTKRAIAMAAALTAAATTAAPAGAANPFDPAVFGQATSGKEKVTTAVYVAPRTAQLLAVWNQDGVACSVTRRMRITGSFFYTPSPSGPSRHYSITRIFRVGNCAEGGPNTGFTLRAFRRHAVCPGGRWHPGEYQFSTEAIDLATGLKASADIDFTMTRPCAP